MSNVIHIIAPSNTMADLPAALRTAGSQRLESLGFKPVFGEHVNNKFLHLSGTASQRIQDLKAAFEDPNACGIMAVYGGYNTNDMLEELANLHCDTPKWIMGYSDVTALLLSLINHSNIQVIHGPGFASFCEPNFFEYSINSFSQAIQGKQYTCTSPDFFASDLWYLKENFASRIIYEPSPWKVYRFGEVIAPIIGGNLDTLCTLIGTPFFPVLHDRILFIESATGQAGPFQRGLVQLRQAGVFNKISGLIIGKAPAETSLCDPKFLTELLDMIHLPEIPVLFDVHCSHVDPMLSIPLNRLTKLSALENPSLTFNYGMSSL